jgi:hypothetical protein
MSVMPTLTHFACTMGKLEAEKIPALCDLLQEAGDLIVKGNTSNGSMRVRDLLTVPGPLDG